MDKTDYNNDVLERMRVAAGLSRQEVADRLSVTRMTVFRAEKGTAASYDLLRNMTRLYGIPVTSILREHGSVVA